jgi:hypothetical protein
MGRCCVGFQCSWDGGRQVCRCGCAFTPACGSVVASATLLFTWGCAPGWYVVGPMALGVGVGDAAGAARAWWVGLLRVAGELLVFPTHAQKRAHECDDRQEDLEGSHRSEVIFLVARLDP